MASKIRAIDRSRSGESQLTEIHKVLQLTVQAVKKKLSEIKLGHRCAEEPRGGPWPRESMRDGPRACQGQCLMSLTDLWSIPDPLHRYQTSEVPESRQMLDPQNKQKVKKMKKMMDPRSIQATPRALSHPRGSLGVAQEAVAGVSGPVRMP